MCNAYQIGRSTARLPDGSLRELFENLPDETAPRLIRRTDPAPVVTAAFDLVTMRWGFQRDRLGTINNSRADKLDGPMWSRAFLERRCLIPVIGFYEWSGPQGKKTTHRFTRPDGAPFWIAGIWEESREFGPCFSMITTVANALMAPIHQRMPAVLDEKETATYLEGEIASFTPTVESLRVEETFNPLAKLKNTPAQRELF